MLSGKPASLVRRKHYVADVFAGDPALAGVLGTKGFELVVLGRDEATWAEPTAALAKLLGRVQ